MIWNKTNVQWRCEGVVLREVDEHRRLGTSHILFDVDFQSFLDSLIHIRPFVGLGGECHHRLLQLLFHVHEGIAGAIKEALFVRTKHSVVHQGQDPCLKRAEVVEEFVWHDVM
jgi:hypothetical protein